MRYVKELRYNFNTASQGYNLATHITGWEGLAPQETVTVNVQVALSPLSSTACQVFVVTPCGKTEPLAKPFCRNTDATAQLSVAVGLA